MLIDIVSTETVEINPGDRVILMDSGRRTRVRRIVQKCDKTYVVFDNNTWRPLSTFDETWGLLEEWE